MTSDVTALLLPQLGLRWIAAIKCFALPCYRPRFIAVTYLVTDPTPARASDPAFCRSLACVEWSCFACCAFYRPSPSPGQRPPFCRSLACVEYLQASWCCGGALCVLRFTLPRYRPRYIAITYLVALRYIVLLILLARKCLSRYRPA